MNNESNKNNIDKITISLNSENTINTNSNINNNINNNNNNNNNKQIKLTSGSFPKFKTVKQYSNIHNFFNNYNLKLKPTDIFFKSLDITNIPELINLHKEWFPIFYGPLFFTDLLEKENIISLGAFFSYNNFEYLIGSIFVEFKIEGDGERNYVPYEAINLPTTDKLLCRKKELGYLMLIGVVEELRKLGIATKLLEEIYTKIFIKKPNCDGIFLHVIESNLPAINFYTKNSFTKIHEMSNYYDIDDINYKAIVFVFAFDDKFKRKYKCIINKSKCSKFLEFAKLMINLVFWSFKTICIVCSICCSNSNETVETNDTNNSNNYLEELNIII